jgi:hypothetical protein
LKSNLYSPRAFLVPTPVSSQCPAAWDIVRQVVAVGDRSGCDGDADALSTCGGLVVEFRSDSSVQGTGFAFSYREMAALPASPPAPSNCASEENLVSVAFQMGSVQGELSLDMSNPVGLSVLQYNTSSFATQPQHTSRWLRCLADGACDEEMRLIRWKAVQSRSRKQSTHHAPLFLSSGGGWKCV